MNISIGKLRGLQQLADSRGIMTMCAIDHRGALKRALNERNPAAASYQDMVEFKLDLCEAVAPFASAILLGPGIWCWSGYSHRPLTWVQGTSGQHGKVWLQWRQ